MPFDYSLLNGEGRVRNIEIFSKNKSDCPANEVVFRKKYKPITCPYRFKKLSIFYLSQMSTRNQIIPHIITHGIF